MSCSHLLDRFQKRISVDGCKRSENDTKTLGVDANLLLRFYKVKTMRFQKRISVVQASQSIHCISRCHARTKLFLKSSYQYSKKSSLYGERFPFIDTNLTSKTIWSIPPNFTAVHCISLYPILDAHWNNVNINLED